MALEEGVASKGEQEADTADSRGWIKQKITSMSGLVMERQNIGTQLWIGHQSE